MVFIILLFKKKKKKAKTTMDKRELCVQRFDSWVAQMVKRLLAMWETWVRSLDWEDPLEKEMATYSSIFA